MIYFYGLSLVLVMVLLISGCITNNSYTQTGKGDHTVLQDKKIKNKKDAQL